MIGLYYLAFFAGNSLVGWVGGFYESMPTTSFWLLHAGFAAGSGAAFLLFKLVLGRRMVASSTDEREQMEADALASRPA